MKTLITSFLIMTAIMSLVIAGLLVFLKLFGKKLSARCRYLLWKAVIIQLCIPLPLVSLALNSLPSSAASAVSETAVAGSVSEYASRLLDSAEKSLAAAVTPKPLQGSQAQLSGESAQQSGTQTEPPAPVQNEASVPESPTSPEKTVTETETAETGNPSANFSADPLIIAVAVWAAGAVIVISVSFIRYGRFSALLRLMEKNSVIKPLSGEFSEIYLEACAEKSIKNPPKLYVSEIPMSPVLAGFFSPRIVIPRTELDRKQLKAIISHELIHHKRRDLIMKLLSEISTAVFWFNPLVYAAAKNLSKETELSCDEEVLRDCDGEERISYGEAMLEIVKKCRHSTVPYISAFHSASKGKRNKERFMNIIDGNKKRRGIGIIAAVLAICIFAGGIAVCAKYVGSIITDDKEKQPEEIIDNPNGELWVVPEKLSYVTENPNKKGDYAFYEAAFSFDNGKITVERTKNGKDDRYFEFVTENGKLLSVTAYDVSEVEEHFCGKFEQTWTDGKLTGEKYTEADGVTTYFKVCEYDGEKLIRSETERKRTGEITELLYEYDGQGRIITLNTIARYSLGEPRENRAVTSHAYEASKETITRDGELLQEIFYNDEGNIISEYNASGPELFFDYDEQGRYIGQNGSVDSGYRTTVSYYKDTNLAIRTEEYMNGEKTAWRYFDPEKLISETSSGIKIQWRNSTESDRNTACVLLDVEGEAAANENLSLLSTGAWIENILSDTDLAGNSERFSYSDGSRSVTMKFSALFDKLTYDEIPLETPAAVTVDLPDYITCTGSLEGFPSYSFEKNKTSPCMSFKIGKFDKDFVFDEDVAKSDPWAYMPELPENTGIGGLFMDESYVPSQVMTSEKGYEYVTYTKTNSNSYVSFVYMRLSDEHILRFTIEDFIERQVNLQNIIDSVTCDIK
ncbi:MAG: M56 family metallopeptidase [Clostridia bacterium]|nr:M56 family metallopeptidase [Clostridia bacterium]